MYLLKLKFLKTKLALVSFASLMVASTLVGNVSFAQDDQSDQFSKCEALKVGSDRLKCFERVLRDMKDVHSTPYRPAPYQSEDEAGENPLGSAPTNVDRFDDFGKPLERREVEQEDMVIKVVKFWEDANGKFSFELANGQVWKETDGSYLRIPGKKKDLGEVTIYKNSFGGYRIKVINNPKDGRVKRVK